MSRVVFAGEEGWGHVLVTEFQGTTLNGLLCADVLWPLNLVPLTTYKYHPACESYFIISGISLLENTEKRQNIESNQKTL